jgi:multicomponent Na+:H+ antiporter subunit A
VGFIGKETVYSAILEYFDYGKVVIILAIFANIFIVVSTLLVGFQPFLGELKKTPINPHEASFQMWFGPLILAFIGLVMGMIPNFVIGGLLDQTACSIISRPLGLQIKLWHGFNLVFGLSILTVGFGISLFWYREKILNKLLTIPIPSWIKPSVVYRSLYNGILHIAKFQTKILQSGYLRYYLIVIIITTIGISLFTFFNQAEKVRFNLDTEITFYDLVIGIIMISGILSAILTRNRLIAVISLGIVGYTIALIFITYSAPDLAMTQFAAETLTVILFVLVIYKLPKYLVISNVPRRIRDFVIAISGGILMTLLTLIITSNELQSELKKYFADNSYLIGKGKNIVNVILVDFRALDTLGEITVLAVAAIGVYALLKLRMKKGE